MHLFDSSGYVSSYVRYNSPISGSAVAILYFQLHICHSLHFDGSSVLIVPETFFSQYSFLSWFYLSMLATCSTAISAAETLIRQIEAEVSLDYICSNM
jgi:hypothetical protein